MHGATLVNPIRRAGAVSAFHDTLLVPVLLSGLAFVAATLLIRDNLAEKTMVRPHTADVTVAIQPVERLLRSVRRERRRTRCSRSEYGFAGGCHPSSPSPRRYLPNHQVPPPPAASRPEIPSDRAAVLVDRHSHPAGRSLNDLLPHAERLAEPPAQFPVVPRIGESPPGPRTPRRPAFPFRSHIPGSPLTGVPLSTTCPSPSPSPSPWPPFSSSSPIGCRYPPPRSPPPPPPFPPPPPPSPPLPTPPTAHPHSPPPPKNPLSAPPPPRNGPPFSDHLPSP